MYVSPLTMISGYSNTDPIASIRYFRDSAHQAEPTLASIMKNWAARDKIIDVCISMGPPRSSGVDKLLQIWNSFRSETHD